MSSSTASKAIASSRDEPDAEKGERRRCDRHRRAVLTVGQYLIDRLAAWGSSTSSASRAITC